MATSVPAGGMTEHRSAAVRQPQAPETDPTLSLCLREKMSMRLFLSLNALVKVSESLFISGPHCITCRT